MKWLTAFLLLSIACHAQAAAAPLLRKVADVPLPGAANRFDYASLDPGSGLLYLNHMGAGEVVVFDIRARKVVAVLKGFPRCTGILAVPALNRVFVSTPGDGHVVALDGKTHAVLARLPAGQFPDGIAFEAGSGRVFVSDEKGGAAIAIDASALKVLKQVPIGGEAGNTQADSEGHLVYTNDQTDGDLVVIDPVKLEVKERMPLGLKGNHGLYLDLSVSNIHPRAGSTAPPCSPDHDSPLRGCLVSVMQAPEPRPRHSQCALARAGRGGRLRTLLARQEREELVTLWANSWIEFWQTTGRPRARRAATAARRRAPRRWCSGARVGRRS
jgi:hypothetical protein